MTGEKVYLSKYLVRGGLPFMCLITLINAGDYEWASTWWKLACCYVLISLINAGATMMSMMSEQVQYLVKGRLLLCPNYPHEYWCHNDVYDELASPWKGALFLCA
jgi:hypothetical protein